MKVCLASCCCNRRNYSRYFKPDNRRHVFRYPWSLVRERKSRGTLLHQSERCVRNGDKPTGKNRQRKLLGLDYAGNRLEPSGGGRITNTISSDLRRINWRNGSFWVRESNCTPRNAPRVRLPP